MGYDVLFEKLARPSYAGHLFVFWKYLDDQYAHRHIHVKLRMLDVFG